MRVWIGKRREDEDKVYPRKGEVDRVHLKVFTLVENVDLTTKKKWC